MKNFYIIIFSLIISIAFASTKEKKSIITKDLQEVINQKTDTELIPINIRFKEQLNLMTRYAELKEMNADIRRQTVVSDLKKFSKASQSNLMNFLNEQSAKDFKLDHKFWLANVISAYASESLIQKLSQRNDIDRIDVNETRILIASPEPTPFIPGEKDVNEITYNVLKVNADDVWALGYTGEGIIVSVIDAGINYNHVDLADHMWEADGYPYHGWDFRNDDNDPMDGHGHGTHCAGTVAGDGTAGSQTGMAPDATLMACKVLGDDGSGEESYVWEAIEFSVEHGANVISMSLGWMHSWNPDRQTWRTTLDNALAAGMVASIAAGNEGGSTNSTEDVRTPGDCPPPWLNPEQTLIGGISAVVCVGATDASDNIAYFSSLGPVEWESVDPFNDYPFNPEMGLFRPDVSAPGVDIKSTDAFNINGYTMMSGTSMATPGVAGVMALLLSKNPGLSPADISMLLETTSVDLGAGGKDNVYGAGRVDALEAIENTMEQGPTYESHVFVDPNGNGEIEAGESIQMSITMFNGSDLDFSNVDVSIACESPYITITDNQENYGDFAAGESIEVIEGFAFDAAANLPGLENIRFNVTATDGTETWESHFTVVSFGPKLFIGNLVIDDAAGNNNGRLDPGENATLIFDIHNGGQADAQDIQIAITNNGSNLSFDNTELTIDALAAESVAQASFDVTVSSNATVGSVEIVQLNLSDEPYSDSKDFTLTIGLIVEDWETGDFTQFNWTFNGGDWFITDQDPYEGNYCSQSANIGDNGSTSLLIDYEAGADGTISFFRKVSSETGYDHLRFYIDNQEKGSWSGEEPWTMEEYEVTAGNHTFKWKYSKDGSVDGGSDCGWVDFIVLPPILLPSIIVDAQANICKGEVYHSEAQVENAESLSWTTDGDGSFDDTSIADATYTPGAEDISTGTVELRLTATGSNGDITSVITLSINPLPEITVAENSDVCFGEEVNISAELLGTAPWILSIENADDFTINESPYSFNWMANQDTSFTILSISDANGCIANSTHQVTAIVRALPEVNIGEDVSVCMNHLVNLDAGNEGATYLWSTGETTQTVTIDSTGMNNDNQKMVSVIVTNEYACSANDEMLISYEDCSGIEEFSSLRNLSVYPNPNQGNFEISFHSVKVQEINIEIVNMLGAIVYQEKLDVNEGNIQHSVDVNTLTAQSYLIILKNADGQIIKRLIIE